jgi:uncharacterized protein (UPF0147 family)
MGVEEDLDIVAEYLSVCLGGDEDAVRELAFIGVKPGDIRSEDREDIRRAIAVLRNKNNPPIERISTASNMVKDLKEKVPREVGKYILNSVSKRLNEARDNYNLEGGRASSLVGDKPWRRGVLMHLATPYSLDMFLSSDRKVALELKKLGISEVPQAVKEVAEKARGIMDDKSLSPQKRAAEAANVLMEPLLPAYRGDRSRREIQELSPEVKGVLWQIANELAYGAY